MSSYCNHCGQPVDAQAKYCSSCGSAVTVVIVGSVAPPPPPPVKAPPPPPPPAPLPAPTGGAGVAAYPSGAVLAAASATTVHPHLVHTHYLRTFALIFLLAIGFSAAYFYLHTPDPSISLDQVRLAYSQEDQLTFDKYVDVPAVLEDSIDQFADYYAVEHKVAHTVLFREGIKFAERMYLSQIAQSIDNFIVTGSLPALPSWAGGSETVAEAISDASQVAHRVLQAQWTYEGLVSQSISGPNAMVEVRVTSPASAGPITLRLQMRRVHSHWRVVAIKDVPRILQQMGIKI